MSLPQDQEPAKPDVFEALARDHGPFFQRAAVQAARELGILEALQTPCDRGTLAQVLQLPPRRLAALLEVLLLDGVLVRDGPRLALGQVPPPQPPLPPHGWGRLAQVLRQDRPLPTEPRDLAGYHAHLLELAADLAPRLWRTLGWQGRLLDLGSGAGGWTRAWLEHDPRHTATCVDVPEVLALARQTLGQQVPRVQFLRTDQSIPADHQVALLGNLLHMHGEVVARELILRAVHALRPGGRLLVKEVRPGTRAAVLFDLNLAIHEPEGTVHRLADLMRWLTDAGLVEVCELTWADSPGSVLLQGLRPR